MIVAVMGIDSGGNKQVMGMWHGSTENKVFSRSLWTDLVDRGLSFEDGILVVIDGSTGLRSEKGNLIDHVPRERQEWVNECEAMGRCKFNGS